MYREYAQKSIEAFKRQCKMLSGFELLMKNDNNATMVDIIGSIILNKRTKIVGFDRNGRYAEVMDFMDGNGFDVDWTPNQYGHCKFRIGGT